MSDYIPVTSRTSKTNDSIITGAGKVFLNLDIIPLMKPTANILKDIQPFLRTNMGKEYSATRTGNTFTRSIEMRDIPIDGDNPYMQEVNANTGTLSMTLMEINQKTLKTTTPMERDTATGALIPSTTIRGDHYNSLTLFAARMGGKGWQVVHIPKCLGTESVAQEFAERGESSIPAVFNASPVRDEITGMMQPPYYIWTFDEKGDMELDDDASGISGASLLFAPQMESAMAELKKAEAAVEAVEMQIIAENARIIAEEATKKVNDAVYAPETPKTGRNAKTE